MKNKGRFQIRRDENPIVSSYFLVEARYCSGTVVLYCQDVPCL